MPWEPFPDEVVLDSGADAPEDLAKALAEELLRRGWITARDLPQDKAPQEKDAQEKDAQGAKA